MIKNEKYIISNYFGLSYENQSKIYNMMVSSLDEKEDNLIIDSIKSIFSCYLDSLKELYETNDKGLKLKSFYVERINNKTSLSVDNFINNKKVTTDEDYKCSFLFNINDYTPAVIENLNKFFDVTYIDDVTFNDFVEGYNSSSYYEQKRFILDLIKNYYIVAYLPESYIPGVNNLNNDFDDLVINLFGRKAFSKYNDLKPIQKVKFIRKFKSDIDDFYRLQTENQERDVKSRRVVKRKHSPSYNHR